MYHGSCYRKCHTLRQLCEFVSGYYPNVFAWVRQERARGIPPETILGMLRAIKRDVIRKHEEIDLPKEELILNVQNA